MLEGEVTIRTGGRPHQHPAIWTYRTASETQCDACGRVIARGDWFRHYLDDGRVACWGCATGRHAGPRLDASDFDHVAGAGVPGFGG